MGDITAQFKVVILSVGGKSHKMCNCFQHWVLYSGLTALSLCYDLYGVFAFVHSVIPINKPSLLCFDDLKLVYPMSAKPIDVLLQIYMAR